MKFLRLLAAIFAVSMMVAPALAQSNSIVVLPNGCGTGKATGNAGSLSYLTVDTTLKLCVNATVNASVGGFQPNGTYATLTATASTSASTALPTGTTVRLSNLGSTAIVSCTFATGAATGLVSNLVIPPLSSVSRVVGAFDHVACIDQTGSTGSNLVVVEGGAGLGNDSGGGGGGSGGGGGAVFGPTANGSAAANPPVLLGGTANGTATGNVGNLKVDASGTAFIDCSSAGNTLCGFINSPSLGIAGTAPTTQTPVATGATSKLQTDLNGNLYVNPVSMYPAGAVPITVSNTGTTLATTATLAAGAAGLKTYLCSYSIRANATGTSTVTNTITGVVTATLSHIMWVPANTAGLGVDEQIFNPCVPSSATATAINVVSGAPGAGGVVSVTATGYQAP